MSIKQQCEEVRAGVKTLTENVRELMRHPDWEPHHLPPTARASEMRATIMLAVRALEDADYRLGRMLQAYDPGARVVL